MQITFRWPTRQLLTGASVSLLTVALALPQALAQDTATEDATDVAESTESAEPAESTQSTETKSASQPTTTVTKDAESKEAATSTTNAEQSSRATASQNATTDRSAARDSNRSTRTQDSRSTRSGRTSASSTQVRDRTEDRDARGPSLGNQSESREQDATRDARQDAREDSRQGIRDTRQSARDTVRGARDEARDTGRDVRQDSRGTARDTRDDLRDTRREYRDEYQDARRDVRNDRQDERGWASDARDMRDDRYSRGDLRDDVRDFARQTARDAIDYGRSAARDAFDDRRYDQDVADRSRQWDDDRRDDDRDFARRQFDDRRSDRDIRRSRDTRITRSQIDNFRAASVSPRDLGLSLNRSARGLVVQDVRSGALAANIGLRPRDQIVAIEDYRVTSDDQFVRYLFDEDWRYDRVTVWVVRNGREVPIYVRPVQLIEQLIVVQDDYDPLHTFGVVLDDRYDRELVVRRVIRNSAADRAGLRPGDVLVRFYGQRLSSPQQFVQVLSRVDVRQAPIVVERDESLREIVVTMPRELRTTSQQSTSRQSTSGQRTTYRQELDGDRFDSRGDTPWRDQPSSQIQSSGQVYQDSFGPTSGAIITDPGQPIYPGQFQPARPAQPTNRMEDRSDRPGILPRLFGR